MPPVIQWLQLVVSKSIALRANWKSYIYMQDLCWFGVPSIPTNLRNGHHIVNFVSAPLWRLDMHQIQK